MFYTLALGIMILGYVSTIFCMKRFKSINLVNLIFTFITFACYISLSLIVFFDVGFYDWNYQNTLPVANVSPFTFSIIPIIFVLPKKIRKHFYLLISLLSVGMFLSAVLGCVYNEIINYKFHFHFLLDYVAHFSISLWGVYLIKSEQVTLNIKNVLISASIILGVATLMMILNVIFDTAFFGLSLNGKHNIYNNVLVDNSYLSALLFYVGLIGVLCLGYLYGKLFKPKVEN